MFFKKSFALLWKNFGYFLACIGLDVVFFIALGLCTTSVSFKMKMLLLEVTTIFATDFNGLERGQSVLSVLFSRNTLPFWKSLVLYALLFVLIIYLVYVVFQSAAWFFSLKIVGKKLRYWSYFKFFALINLFWFAVFVVYNLVDLTGDISMVLNPSLSVNFISAFAVFFLLLSAYFAVISYVLLDFKKSFVVGWNYYRQVLPCFLIVLAYFVVLDLLLSELFLFSFNLAVVVGFVLFLPALSFARVFMALDILKVK